VKKSWIFVIIVIGLVSADLLIRHLQTDTDTPKPVSPVEQLAAPPVKADNQPEKPAKKPDAQPGLIPNPEANLPLGEDDAPKNIPAFPVDKCIAFGDTITQKAVKQWEASDLAFLKEISTSLKRESIEADVHEYIACKAYENKDITICPVRKKFLTRVKQPVECETIYKLMIPVRSHYIDRMTSEQFADLYGELPPSILSWMQEFFVAIRQQQPESCDRLADNPFTMGFCQAATGKAIKADKNSPLYMAQKMIQILKTGKQVPLMGGDEGNFGQALMDVSLKKKDGCKAYFLSNLKLHCSSIK